MPKPLSKSKIDRIVAAVNSGEINLSDLDQDCNDDDEIEWVWALVDSGSGVHAASWEKHFPGSKLEESTGQRAGHTMTAANGSKIKDEGQMTIRVKTVNGHTVRIPFVNADVSMPILSLAKLASEHDAVFRQDDGELIHRRTKNRIPFVKRLGVYFMKVAIKKSVVRPDGPSTDPFGRSGN